MENLASQPVRAVPKPSYGRSKPTRKQRGDISPAVSKAVKLRSGERCERCGWRPGNVDPTGKRMGLQNAHLIRRGDVEVKTHTYDIARLCGPSTNSGTCHWWIDSRSDGAEWAKEFREYLKARERA